MKSTVRFSLLIAVGFFLGFLQTHAQVTQIYSDYGGYWTSSSAAVSTTQPNNSHNLLAFKKNGVVYSTGVDDAKLTANGVSFNAQKYRALPISEVPTSNPGNSFYAGWGWLYDGISSNIPSPAPTFTASQLAVFLTDGVNGLNMGTGLANIPNGTTLTFNLSANGIRLSEIGDGIPDIVFIQIATPTTNGDKLKFVNGAGTTVGTELSFKMNNYTNFPVVGIWKCDFIKVNPSVTPPSHIIATTRDISVMAVDISELGINASNYSDASKLVYTGSGEGDPAFIAFKDQSLSIATFLSVTSQPTVYVSGTDFPTSVTVTVKDGAGAAVPQSGTSVTVAIESGGGTLSGTLTRNTDAGGTATFNDLKITGSGDHRLLFSSNGLVSASSTIISNNAIGGTATANQVVAAGSIPEALTLSDYSGTIQWQVSTTGSDGWGPISTATEATLSGALMASMTATRYYRAEVTKSSTTAYSNIITIEVGSSTSGSYSSSGIDYTVATITGPGTWTAPAGVVSADYLLIGGGGGGGMGSSRTGGGGSGGEVKSGTITVVPGTAYIATIGAGGSAGTGAAPAAAGGSSTFSTISASGGGRGGQSTLSPGTEAYGGGHHHGQNGAIGSVSYRGGNGYDAGVSTGVFSAGGGGGAGGNGGDGNSSKAGDGGSGLSNSWQNGSLQYYGGGGGGAFQRGTGGTPTPTSANRGVGGSGGGGDGGYTLQSLLVGASPSGTSGTQNTGGGGGAAALDGRTNISAGAGGSGLLVIRHRTTTGVETNSPGIALDFDGVDDYVNLPSGVYFDDNTFTVESWVYLKSHQQYGRLCDFSTGDLSNNVMFSVSEINDGKPYFLVFVGGTPSKLKSSQAIPLNRWTHLAYVQDGSTGYMYINGVEVASGAMSTPPNLTRNLCYIGESSGTGSAGDMSLDEFRIWDVARSPSMIGQGMYTEVTVPSSGLAHYYKFSQASGTTLVDQGSDPKHGTLMNFSLSSLTSNWTESYAMVVPQSTSATDIKTSGFIAQWTLPSVGTVEGLRFEHTADQTFSTAVTSVDLSATATSFSVDGLSAGTTRYWRLRAEKSSVSGQGGFSAVQTTTTLAGATWNGLISGAWNTAGNWTTSGVPATGSAIVIPSGTTWSPVLSGSISLSSLSLASGNLLDVGSHTLTVTGNLANNGTISATSGKVTIAGSTAQAISGTGTISNLEVDNAAGVTIQSGSGNMLTVTGVLSPTTGKLYANGNVTLKSDALGTARVGPGSTEGGYIVGDVVTQRHLTVTRSTVSPVRSGRAWRLVTIPVTGSGTLRDFFMAGQIGTDLTSSVNQSAQPAHLGTVIVGHDHADAAAAAVANFDYIGVPRQVSSLRRYVANSGGGSFASSQVPDMNTNYSLAEQGYGVFVRGDRQQDYTGLSTVSTTTLQATGELKQGTQSIAIPPVATTGFVLLGNPYMSLLDMEKVMADPENAGVIDNTIHVWDANIDGNDFRQGGYRQVTRPPGSNIWTSTGAGTNPQYIESGVAFFVKPSSTGGVLKIKESHKVMAGTPGIQPLGSTQNGPARLFVNLEVRDTGEYRRLVDGVVAFFDDRYRDTTDDPVDIRKMSNMGTGSIGLRREGVRFSMEGRSWPMDTASKSLKLDMRSLGSDEYVLRLMPIGIKREGFSAWLKDHHLSKEVAVEVEKETSYHFRRSGVPGIDTARFEIVYHQAAMVGVATQEPPSVSGKGISLYPNPTRGDDVWLSFRWMESGTYRIQVIDMNGRMVASESMIHGGYNVDHRLPIQRRLSSGRYSVFVTDEREMTHILPLIVQ